VIVYEARFPNGKKYIGLTETSLNKRMREHKYHTKYSNRKVYNAIRKYGWDNVSWGVLVECSTIEELRREEKRYIAEYDTTNIKNGYNHREGGDGGKHDEETKEKISLSNYGEKNGMYKKIPWNKGKKLSKEHRENLSKAHLGHIPWNKGKKLPKTGPCSEEVKRKIGKANSGSNNGLAKLTWEIVKEIRARHSTGKCTQKELAKIFRVSSTTINVIVNNKSWRISE